MSQQPQRKFVPGLIAGLYAVCGTLWILASGTLLTMALIPSGWQGNLEFIKGIAFVVATSGMLYLLLSASQRRQQAAQQASEARAARMLECFFAQPFVAMVVINPKTGNWLQFNDRACELLGYTRDEMTGKNWRELIHPDDLPGRVERLRQMRRGEIGNFSGVTRYRHKDGSTVFLQVNLSCVREPDGKLAFYVVIASDITQRIAAEQEFALHTRLLEKMAAIAHIGAWSLDLRQNKLIWSPEVYHIHGLDPSQPVQVDRAIDFYAPEAQPVIRQAVQAAIETGTPWDLELPLIDAAGNRRWVRAQGEAMLEDGKAVMIHGAFQDITARRQRDDQLQSLLRQQETILGNTTVGMMQIAHRQVVFCNRRLEEMFGYEPGELNGQSVRAMYFSDADYEAAGANTLAAMAINNSYTHETYLRRKDGSRFRVLISGRANNPADPKAGTIWCLIDVSEAWETRLQAQRMLKAVEQSPVAIVITNYRAEIEYCNSAMCASSGYSMSELIGQNPRVLKSGELPDGIYEDLWQTLAARKNWQGTLHNRRKNGELYWESVSISPIIDEHGEVTHYLGIKEDITKRMQLMEQVERYRQHLEETVRERTAELSAALEAALIADRTKDQFLANVSHEMRTPLNVVIGLADLARRVTRDERIIDYLGKITGAGKNLAALINDLLDLSKIVAGHLEFEQIPFSPRELIARSRSALMHKAEEKGLQLSEVLDDAIPPLVVGDPLRIEQILLNLLNNAIKFTPAGTVSVRIHPLAEEGDRLCLGIDVEDSGIGIAEADRVKLFQPFSQADASITRQYGGTGLGLAISKRLAEMMGGDLTYSPRPDGGSIFRVRLWVGRQTLPADGLPAGENAVTVSHYQNVQVLVVDDQPTNLEIVRELLLAVGIQPRLAANGQEALDILQTEGRAAFDLVLMDIQMPILDGLSATRQIRQWPAYTDLPVIALTAHTMEHEKRQSLAAGVNDHIGKPFETANFYAVLAKWIPRIKQQAVAPASNAPSPGFPEIDGIDTAAGLSRFAGNAERYRHWLQTFASEAPALLSQLAEQLASNDHTAARKTAHALRGRAGMLGAGAVHGAATALEQALENGQTTDAAWRDLQESAAPLCQAISSLPAANAPDTL